MDDSTPKPRINASMLGQYQGKYVTLVGRAHDVDNQGMAFKLTSPDKQEVNVRLSEPLQENVDGVIQVQGLCDGKSLVNSTYVPFNEEKTKFDLDQYNRAVEFMARFQDVLSSEGV